MGLEFTARLQVSNLGPDGDAFWVEVPDEIAVVLPAARVEATVGSTTWRTLLIRSADLGARVLPIKKAVRDAEGLDEGAVCTIHLEAR
jgi:hypothetical protein